MIEDSTTRENEMQPQSISNPPDEQSGFHVEGHIKIYDPSTNEIFIIGRA